jgi:hypothetical protein
MKSQPNAVAITSLDYATGQTVTWADGCDIPMWERPLRRSVRTTFTIDHILASAALPIVFPAVRLGKHWHGDGGIRLSAPLSPALHLGATRMLAISTHYAKSFSEADEPQVIGYPPPAQILGQLMDAIFLDVMDEDAVRMEHANAFLRDLPPEQRHGYRIVDFAVIRPSQDLGKLAADYEPQLPRTFRFLTRSLGTRETSNADFMSLFLFVPGYLKRLIFDGSVAKTFVRGPENPILRQEEAALKAKKKTGKLSEGEAAHLDDLATKRDVNVPMEVHWKPGQGSAEFVVQGTRFTLKTGQWSDWVPLTFSFNFLLKIHGMIQFLAIEADQDVRVVVFDSAVDDYFLNHSDFMASLRT